MIDAHVAPSAADAAMLSISVALSGEINTLPASGSVRRRSVSAMAKPVDESVRFIDTGLTGGKDSAWPHPAMSTAPTNAAAKPRRPAIPLIRWTSRLRNGLALYVRQFFGHLAVADFEQVDAPHMPRSPVEPPPNRGPIARDDHLLGLETGLGRIVEELVPERPHRLVADHPLAVWRRQRVLEYAVVGHHRHHGVDVMPAERLVEGIDGLGRTRAHPWPIILAMTSARFGPPLPNGTECTRSANTILATAPTCVTFTCSALS